MTPRRRPLAAPALVGAVAAALAGCSTPGMLGADQAGSSVEALLEPTVFHSYAPDVVTFAEAVEDATAGTSIRMVAVEESDAPARGDGEPVGWITLSLTVGDTLEPAHGWGEPREMEPGPHCFRVAFDHWGVDDIRHTDCPADLDRVPAPPSERPAVAANAEEAVRAVLTALPADLPPADDVVAQVEALLEPHANGVTPLAAVTAQVEDGVVAVATGDDDDCVLVARTSAGEVHDVHVPSVYLLPGELGCQASTAFADLRPPH
jgi:hypothetical protein